MSLLITNIKSLVGIEKSGGKKLTGKDLSELKCIDKAFLLMDKGLIKDFGEMKNLNLSEIDSVAKVIDASGKFVFPSWCDAHTHLVFAGNREQEFNDRLRGLSYEEIAKRGGGILNSAAKLRETSEDELVQSALERLNDIIKYGTGAVEIKSGYGLSTESELKMLRVIKKLKAVSPITIKATFLGAHAVPPEFKDNKKAYIELLIHEMLPKIASEKLADYCDVFCEKNYFTKEETMRILEAASALGMKGKIHAEQLSHSGGIEAGVESKATSVDHLEYANEHDIKLLLNSETIPVILPGAQFFLQLPFPPARKMIDAGLPLAIASDFNPGSSPSGNMNLMVALACVQYKLTPAEAIQAATVNSSWAMGLGESHGSIAKGRVANVFISKEIDSYSMIPYSFGSNLVEQVILKGEKR